MAAAATEPPDHIDVTSRRGLVVVAMCVVALVAGLALRHVGAMLGDDTGAMVGILVASLGSIFFFPALQTYLLALRPA